MQRPMAKDTIKILFICSGNTCRSPMAAAIARHFAASRPQGLPRIEVESAGAGAARGMPMTLQAERALERLGIAVEPHESRPVTLELLEEADIIFVMTPAHLAGVRAMAPHAASKARLLDAEGEAVPDPIGGSQHVYDEACRHLADLIAAQLKELDR